jgi:HAD superfamily hydrolase (TIGR01509 family)
VDSEKVHEKAKRKTLATFGLEVPEGLFDDFMGRTDRHLFAHLRDIYGLSDEQASAMYNFKQQAYHDLSHELELVPGALECLEALAGKTRLALVTSASRANQRISSNKFDLDRFFEFVLAQEDVSDPKPHPAPFLEAARRLGLHARDLLVIEDSPNGVTSAVTAGCSVVGLTTNFPAPTLLERGAGWIAPDFETIHALLDYAFSVT